MTNNNGVSENDKEIFELCKEVYEKTGWNDNDAPLERFDVDDPKSVAPLYTSDYLLEKLPPEIDKKLLVITNGDRPQAGYAERNNYGEYTLDENFYRDASYSNTVLKALLRLTIALHEAGELKV